MVVDEATGYKHASFLKQKSQSTDQMIAFMKKAERETGNKCVSLRTDNGGEYINGKLLDYLTDNGITHETSVPGVHQQNGMAERANRTFAEHAACLIHQRSLPKYLWAEAIRHVCITFNRLPTRKVTKTTPYEQWFKQKPDVSRLRVFGCEAYGLVLPEQRKGKKLQAKSVPGIFIGYGDTLNQYKLYHKEDRSFKLYRDVRFLERSPEHVTHTLDSENEEEEQMLQETVKPVTARKRGRPTGTKNYEKYANIPVRRSERKRKFDFSVHEKVKRLHRASDSSGSESDHDEAKVPDDEMWSDSDDVLTASENAVAPNRTKTALGSRKNGTSKSRSGSSKTALRIRHHCNENTVVVDQQKTALLSMVDEEDDHENCLISESAFVCSGDDYIPDTFSQAISCDERDHWTDAMNKERESHAQNKTWKLVPRPKQRKVIKSKWVFDVKRKPDGSLIKFKARQVAKGFSQIEVVDYSAVFAPVARSGSIRTVLSLAASQNMKMMQFDVCTAFLYGDLEEEIYMEQPDGYSDGTDRVCLLQKGLYGLKQASRQWNLRFNSFLEKHGLKRSSADPCVYTAGQDMIVCL